MDSVARFAVSAIRPSHLSQVRCLSCIDRHPKVGMICRSQVAADAEAYLHYAHMDGMTMHIR